MFSASSNRKEDSRVRRWGIIVGCTGLLLLAGLFGAGELLTYPALHLVGPAPEELAAINVSIPVESAKSVAGWMVPGRPGAGAILLLHGVRSDRRSMLQRAIFLNRLGFGVLLIDLPGHGESPADHITFGVQEALGVKAALSYLERTLSGERIGVIGVSLGAASVVLSRPNPALSAVVLESMYPTIEEAVSNRLKVYLGSSSTVFAPLLINQLPLRLGISPTQLHPIEQMQYLHCPVLIISGSVDQRTTLVETQRIFDATPEPKSLWIITGAKHVDLHAFAAQAYETRVGDFMTKYLRK